MEQKKSNKWKIIGIIGIVVIVLFTLENLLIGYLFVDIAKDNKNTNVCYYDICEKYPDAQYEDGVCKCYDYDLTGYPALAKSKVMN